MLSGALRLAGRLRETATRAPWWLVPAVLASAYVNSVASVIISIVSHRMRERRLASHRPASIILVRHGESLGNTGEEAYSHTPDPLIPLTDSGVRQAELLGEKLREKLAGRKACVYVSPYERSRRTADIAMRGLRHQVVKWSEDVRLREQEFAGGFQNTKLPRAERRQYSRFFFRFPGGESGADCFDRVSLFLESLHRDFNNRNMSEDVVVIFSHGLLCRLFVMRWFHWSHEKFEETDNLPNCGMVELRRTRVGDHEEYVLTEESLNILFKSHGKREPVVLDKTPSMRHRGGSLFEFDEASSTSPPPPLWAHG